MNAIDLDPIAPQGEIPLEYRGTGENGDVFGQQNIGKDGFIKLLIAQMENQDPLNPTSNEDFAAQLAQFSGLEQMQNLNQSFEKMASFSNIGNASVLIGKEVSYLGPGNLGDLTGKVDKVVVKDSSVHVEIGGELIPADKIISVSPVAAAAVSPTI